MNIWNLTTKLSDTATDLKDALESVVESAGEETAAAGGDLSTLIENFNPMKFVENLSYMGVGMLGIFIVMGTLIIGTAVLNKVTNRKTDK